jgi:hypothetical protein
MFRKLRAAQRVISVTDLSLIAVLKENRLSAIATLRHVVRETGYHHAGQTRHYGKLSTDGNTSTAYLFTVSGKLRMPNTEERVGAEWDLYHSIIR